MIEIALAIALYAGVQGFNAAEHRKARAASTFFGFVVLFFTVALVGRSLALIWK